MPATVGSTWSDTPDPRFLLAEEIGSIRSVLGSQTPEESIIRALTLAGNNVDRAINILLDAPTELPVASNSVRRNKGFPSHPKVKKEEAGLQEEKDATFNADVSSYRSNALISEIRVKKEDHEDALSFQKDATPMAKKEPRSDDDYPSLAKPSLVPYLNPRPITAIRPGSVRAQIMEVCSDSDSDAKAETLSDPDWFLVGKNTLSGLSTCRGRKNLKHHEVVDFSFPSLETLFGLRFLRSKTVSALSQIVRVSTKQCGEIGRLTPEWSKCLIPLVSSSKVKIQGWFVHPPPVLSLMQEIQLIVRFYIHSSIFDVGDKSTWNLETPQAKSTDNPLRTMFKLVRLTPFKKADFTPSELDKRKRSLDLKEDDYESTHVMGLAKRRRGDQTYHEQSNDEQAISEDSLNKLVGVANDYNLEEASPPCTLVPGLWPYQKQALYWMSGLEKGMDVEQAAKTLHPCWSAYKIADRRTSAVYVNEFSGEVTTKFPSASQMARGGILADAMGLGKTVMTIALILARPSAERLICEENMKSRQKSNKATKESVPNNHTVKGGTLIVCPLALLGQWKDELETHSKPGTLSIFVHYGGYRTNDMKVISEHDVVLTTYGVLSSAYKVGLETLSIFHQIDWYRVVLDEAHTIKSSKTQVAQSVFALKSHCRWCLTGTPIQNTLEDLYSLICFLHVEPWSNWSWWNNFIQGPYERGDERGLRLVKAILRPLMLRRTKDTRDKNGRPILVLPPASMQIVECKQSEAERNFYDALYNRSKVRFDQFVAEGKVMQNYASILEILLRLRQCCNHPFLVMNLDDVQKNADLNKRARRFLEGSHSSSGSEQQEQLINLACQFLQEHRSSSSTATNAYVEEVVEGICKGKVSECPICLESASDDPVLTSCGHTMCRECLLSSWENPSGGRCPICRKTLAKSDLLIVPSESLGSFQFDVHGNWKESSKVTKLMEYLENITKSGEKSIVFSQWISFLDLLEIPLSRKGIGFLRYDGKLSQKNRVNVVKEFSDSNNISVLLMSLKAGGVGLNLTAASNVFIMDPWWNPAVEEQAIMRIHRIGQRRQVQVRRFIVKNSVEERLQQVQARKQRMIAGALTDEEIRSTRIEDLKVLFT